MSRWTDRLPALLTFLFTLALIVPWQGNLDRLGALRDVPVPSGSANPAASTVALLEGGAWWRVEPDYSLFLVLHESSARGAPWLLVSPMGPYGFLFRGWHPGTAAWLLIGWIVLAASLWYAAWSLAPRWWHYGALLLVIFANPRDAVLLLLPVLLLLQERERPSYVCAFATSIAALVKSSSLVIAAVVVLAITIDDVRRRRVPRVAIVFLISFAALYALSGQGHFFEWLTATMHILGSFSEGWTLDETAPIAVIALFTALACIPAAVEAKNRRWIHAAALLLIAGATLKAGLVRYDAYHVLIVRTIVLALIVLYASRIRFSKLVVAAALIGILPVIDAGELARQFRAAASPFRAHRESAQLFARELDSIRASTSRPPIDGTVDWYDSRQSVVIAHRLDYAPRPVFQGVNVANQHLGRMNAEHLRSRAPAYLFYEPLPFDDRIPSGEDAWSWLDRLAWYEPLGGEKSIVLLRRRAAPRPVTLRPIARVTSRFGETIAVPPANAVWVKIDFTPSLRGKLAALTFGAPPLYINAGGRRFRLMRSVAAHGFLLSPLIENASQYARFSEDRHGSRVGTISLETNSPAAYQEQIQLEFLSLE